MTLELLQATDLDGCRTAALGVGTLVVFTHRSPAKETPNEDVIGWIEIAPDRAVLAVADGMGGAPAGDQAAALAMKELLGSIGENGTDGGRTLRECVLDGFERAGARVREITGSGTTLAVATIEQSEVRTYHVGDSAVLVTGQRGSLKLWTTPHSPTGYAIEAGLMDEREALGHEERHMISNFIGDPSMTLEMSSPLPLATFDTLLLASDGLFDNLTTVRILDVVRKGSLERAGARLVEACRGRMAAPEGSETGKPDDLSFLLFRPARLRSPRPLAR
jgi:serine/threonine protein phosphatase PrpC